MTILEKKSERKKKAILYMVKTGEYSIGYALAEVEKLSDAGKLVESDYEELAEYLEGLLAEETEQSDTEVNSTEQIETKEEREEE